MTVSVFVCMSDSAGGHDRFLTAMGHSYHFEYILISSFVGMKDENTQTKSNMVKVWHWHPGRKGAGVCVCVYQTAAYRV